MEKPRERELEQNPAAQIDADQAKPGDVDREQFDQPDISEDHVVEEKTPDADRD
jgi:hypothetical protein